MSRKYVSGAKYYDTMRGVQQTIICAYAPNLTSIRLRQASRIRLPVSGNETILDGDTPVAIVDSDSTMYVLQRTHEHTTERVSHLSS